MLHSSRIRVVLVGLVAAGLGLVLVRVLGNGPARAGAERPQTGPSSPINSLRQSGINRSDARRDAARLIDLVRLPSGAKRLSSEPRGDGGWLRTALSLESDAARSNAHQWWVVRGHPRAVMAFVKAHAPAGSRQTDAGSGGNLVTHSHSWMLGYSWPSEPGVLGDREVEITVTALSASTTGVLLESQSDWVVPRPTSERIPSSVRVIDIRTVAPDRPRAVVRVTKKAQVRRIVAIFNAMPIVQPIIINCPALVSGGRQVTFSFLSHPRGSAVAEAGFTEYPNLGLWSGPCTPVTLTIEGHRQRGLTGGHFIPQVEKILGSDQLG